MRLFWFLCFWKKSGSNRGEGAGFEYHILDILVMEMVRRSTWEPNYFFFDSQFIDYFIKQDPIDPFNTFIHIDIGGAHFKFLSFRRYSFSIQIFGVDFLSCSFVWFLWSWNISLEILNGFIVVQVWACLNNQRNQSSIFRPHLFTVLLEVDMLKK